MKKLQLVLLALLLSGCGSKETIQLVKRIELADGRNYLLYQDGEPTDQGPHVVEYMSAYGIIHTEIDNNLSIESDGVEITFSQFMTEVSLQQYELLGREVEYLPNFEVVHSIMYDDLYAMVYYPDMKPSSTGSSYGTSDKLISYSFDIPGNHILYKGVDALSREDIFELKPKDLLLYGIEVTYNYRWDPFLNYTRFNGQTHDQYVFYTYYSDTKPLPIEEEMVEVNGVHYRVNNYYHYLITSKGEDIELRRLIEDEVFSIEWFRYYGFEIELVGG